MALKKLIAKNGKRLLEKSIFQARKSFVEPHLDPRRDSLLLSWATYSPWLLDESFLASHAQIKNHTLVDIYRCYELWHLAAQVKSIPGDFLEVGTWRGGTGCLLGKRAQDLNLEAQVFLCDTFEGVVKAGDADSYGGGEHADTSQDTVKALINSLNLTNTETLAGMFPEDTGEQIAGRKFRFCHIDVDVYQSAKDILDWVWGHMPVGGLVVFDDFGFSSTRGIAQLVHEVESSSALISFQNINGHAVFVKVADKPWQ